MRIAYWIVAGLLALLYLFSGGSKVVRSKDQLRPMMGWVDSMPLGLLRTIGVLEVLGALGLILPPLTGIAAGLALAAATGLVLVQLGGAVAASQPRRGQGDRTERLPARPRRRGHLALDHLAVAARVGAAGESWDDGLPRPPGHLSPPPL